jgi:peptidoglycan/LPS O-acetylase OafA/YrhL
MHSTMLRTQATVPAGPAVRATPYRPLGGFRCGLALMVMAQHFQHLLAPPDRVLFSRLGLGIVAVAVFFAISGFVVAEANMVFYPRRPLAFLANRLLRIVPPYLAALALSAAVHTALWWHGRLALWDFNLTGSPLNPGLLLTGLLGLVPGFHPAYVGQTVEFIPFAWSLRVEMAFYAAASCLLLMAQRWRRAPALALCLATLTALAWLPGAGASLLSDMPLFLAGIALFLLLAKPTLPRQLFAGAALAAACFGFASLGQHGAPDLAVQFLLLGGLLFAFACLAVAPVGPRWQAIDRRLGDLAYPLYLNHYAVGIALFDLWPQRSLLPYSVGILTSVILAHIMARLVDAPLQHVRNRVRGRAL